MRLLVVAGHGKKTNGVMDNGAGGHGYNEAERVRTLANRMKALGGASVILGDQSKKWIDYELYNKVNKSEIDCAIELHMDSSESASAHGGHVIIKEGFKADKYDLALEKFIKSYFPGRSETLKPRPDLKAVNMCANRGINFRLLETCFISNAADMAKFNRDVDAVAKGILSAFGIGVSGNAPQNKPAPNKPASKPIPPAPAKKSNETIAQEVIDGKWGNGNDRKAKITAAGYNYSAVQAIVNQKLTGKPSGKKSNDTIANEVIAGKWGNGAERKRRLAAAGYNYSTIQTLVNKKLK